MTDFDGPKFKISIMLYILSFFYFLRIYTNIKIVTANGSKSTLCNLYPSTFPELKNAVLGFGPFFIRVWPNQTNAKINGNSPFMFRNFTYFITFSL